MAFDLRHLRNIAVLADLGNFSRAAEVIGITQPALSRSVAGLEAEIGFSIFDRTPTGVIPTVMGAQLLKDTRALLLQARQLEVEAKALAAGEGGTLNIGLGPLLASLILPHLLAALADRFPRLRVTPIVGSAEELVSSLAERRIEMCLFAEGTLRAGRMTTRAMGSITVAMIARAGHPLAGLRGLHISDLGDFPLATGSYDGRMQDGATPLPTIVCENYHILRDIVLGTDTIWLSSLALAPPADPGALVELDVLDFPAISRTIILARMDNCTPSRAGREAEVVIENLLRRVG